MDIEKIKNYNQKVLAVLLTTLIAFAVIGLLALIFVLFTEVFNFSRSSNNYSTQELNIQNNESNGNEADAYKLHVAFQFPDLVDTLNQLFIIPVSHQTESEIQNNFLNRGKYQKNSSYDKSTSYDYNAQSNYVNLLVYDAKAAKLEKLFTQQILIGEYEKYYYKDDIILVFEAANKDTDKDGKLSLEDETALYFYSLKTKALKQAKMEGKTVLQYEFVHQTKNAIIRFGISPNLRKDGNFISSTTLSQFDYETDKLLIINDNKLEKELETFATGKK